MPDSDMSSPGQESRPYSEVSDSGYAEYAADNFTLDMTQPGFTVLRGTCPRCEDFMVYPVLEDVYKTTRPNDGGGTSKTPGESDSSGRVEPMICTCEGEHPGRPAGAEGCGAYWSLRLTFEPR